MDEFEEYYKNSEWFGTYQSDLMMEEAFEAGQQSQQAKVEELQTQLSLQRQRVKAFEEELASSRNYGDELQKRVDAATRKWIAVTSIATTCPNQLPDEFFQKLDELHDALCGYELEQALNGDQYDEHRKKAEEAISKGASLTNHRIEL